MYRVIVNTVALIGCLSILTAAQAATPLGSGFTYQGRLDRNGAPTNGVVHLRFSLWDAAGSGDPPTGGTQIGASQILTDVPIAEGVFTVVLNSGGQFGTNAFNGEGRWLQIEVCENTGCSSLTILNPRQPLTGVPYSLTALSSPWSGLKNVPEGFADSVDNIGDPVWEVNEEGGISYNVGGVGIGAGTSLLGARLQVNDGRIRIRESATLERWDLFYDTPSQKFYLQENAAYNHLVFTRGPEAHVGIGTDSPEDKLTVFTDKELESGILSTAHDGHAIKGFSYGPGFDGVIGVSENQGTGVGGRGKTGVGGIAAQAGHVAIDGFAVLNALAGKFTGDIDVSGNVIKTSDSSRIDHPLDPANKYLFHSSIESPDRMNVYNGNVVTDASGYAKVMLPDYFEALNEDYRYQLTVIGQFAQAIVLKEIINNSFTIQTDKPNVKVSWLVSGVRQDAWAKSNPMEIEKAKSDKERGKYLSPEFYGQPKEMGINYRPASALLPGPTSKSE